VPVDAEPFDAGADDTPDVGADDGADDGADGPELGAPDGEARCPVPLVVLVHATASVPTAAATSAVRSEREITSPT
jgi:hypothetical protein